MIVFCPDSITRITTTSWILFSVEFALNSLVKLPKSLVYPGSKITWKYVTQAKENVYYQKKYAFEDIEINHHYLCTKKSTQQIKKLNSLACKIKYFFPLFHDIN